MSKRMGDPASVPVCVLPFSEKSNFKRVLTVDLPELPEELRSADFDWKTIEKGPKKHKFRTFCLESEDVNQSYSLKVDFQPIN